MSQAGLDKFTADNPWIFDLISYFDGEGLPIPWNTTAIGSGYVQYMIPNYNAAKRAINSLNLSKIPTSREATAAAKALFDQTRSTWDKMSDVGVMVWESTTGGTMDVPYEILATFSATAFLQMELGFHLPSSGIAQEYLRDTEQKVARELQSGRITEAQAVETIRNNEKALQDHASTINEGLSAIAYLDREGFFNSQKSLGAIPILGVVLGLAAIAAAALVIVSVYQISTVNSIITKECSKFQNEKYRLACITEVSKKLPSIDFSEITGQLAKWLTIGVLVAGGVYFGPLIARRYFSEVRTRRELKA